MNELICDTNFWYHYSGTSTIAEQLKSKGYSLAVSPITLIELVGKLDSYNFNDRRTVAKCVVNHADTYLEDAEYRLCEIWGLRPPSNKVNWKDGFVSLANAPSLDELRNGYDDVSTGMHRKIGVDAVRKWRGMHYKDYREKIIDAVTEIYPDYKIQTGSSNPKYLKKEVIADKRVWLNSDENTEKFINATLARAKMRVPFLRRFCRDRSRTEEARKAVKSYYKAYTEYLLHCAGKKLPELNDLGDHDFFLYVQSGKCLCTADGKWKTIADSAGFGPQVGTAENFLV